MVVALLLAAAAAPAPPAPPVEVESRRILREGGFPFCGSGALPPDGDARAWCEVARHASACPELEEACAAAGKAGAAGGGEAVAEGGALRGASTGGAGGRSDSFSPWDFTLPDLSFLLWVVLAAVLAGVLVLVTGALRRRREERGLGPQAPDATLVPEAQGLTEAAVLLRRAREESGRDAARALALLYAAALRHLEDEGLVRWDPSTTNRAYVRAVRGRTPIDATLAQLVREVEGVRFGRRAPAKGVFEALYEPVARAIGGALLLALVATGAAGCQAGDSGLDGHAAFADLLRSQGIEVERFSLGLREARPDDPPAFIDAGPYALSAELLAGLERAVLGGGRFLVAAGATQQFEGWPWLSVEDGEGDADGQAGALVWDAKALPSLGRGVAVLPGRRVLALDEGERDPPQELVTRGGHPFAVRWRTERGALTVVADRRLFSNGAMAVPADAALAVALARDTAGAHGRLAFAELAPEPPQTPADSLGRAGLWPLMLQALAVLALLVIARGAAFGTLRDRSERGRREFAEHVRALGLHLRQGGTRLAAGLYAAWALERLWQRASPGGDRRDLAPLSRALAARLRLPEPEVRALLDEAERLRRDPDAAPEPARDLAFIRRLGEVVARL